jgi:hypothetical protein
VKITLKLLSEQYALRAREFADAVALLGRHNSVGPQVLKLCKKIKRQRELCGDAEKQLERFIQQEIEDSAAGRSLTISSEAGSLRLG